MSAARVLELLIWGGVGLYLGWLVRRWHDRRVGRRLDDLRERNWWLEDVPVPPPDPDPSARHRSNGKGTGVTRGD